MSKKAVAIFLAVIVIVLLIGFFLFIHFNPSFLNRNNVSAEDSSWNNVWQRGKLLVGINMPYGSMEFLNEKGEIDGLDIDVVKEIARRLGVKIEINNYEWDDLFPAVKSGKIDIAISGIGINAERSAEMLFSNPYINAGSALIVKKDNESIKGAGDLMGKKIGSQKDTTGIEEARILTDLSLVTAYDDYGDDIINDLKNGKIDAILLGYEAVSGILKANSDLKMPCPPISDAFAGIPTKLGNKSLMANIDKVLREMKLDGTLKNIENKWLSVNE